MKPRKCRKPSTWHGEVYHAAPRCQAAALTLTSRRLHGLKKACQVEGQKTGACFASQPSERMSQVSAGLSRTRSMSTLCGFKGLWMITLMLVPDRKDDSDPDIGKCSHGLRVTFSFLAFALIIGSGPRFTLGRLPGKLVQGVAQGFDTRIASMRFGIGAAFIGDRRGASQGLQTGRFRIPCTIMPDLCEQTRSQSLSRTGRTTEDLVVFMCQKKSLDLLIVDGNLLKQGQQLFDQRLHQASFGTGRDRIGHQMRLMQGLDDLGGDRLCLGMSSVFE